MDYFGLKNQSAQTLSIKPPITITRISHFAANELLHSLLFTYSHSSGLVKNFTVVEMFLNFFFPFPAIVEAEVEAMYSFSFLILPAPQNGSEVNDAIVCFLYLSAEAPVEDY